MAAVACRRRPREHIVHVARCARQRYVRSRQRITRVLQVVELGIEPGIHRVTGFARRWKSSRKVINHRRPKILLMTRVARR